MEQYFRAVNISKGEFLEPHDYDSFSKLMEHSERLNNFMLAVEGLIQLGGRWYKNKIVWAGEYSENGLFVPKGYEGNLYKCTKDNTFGRIITNPVKALSHYLLNHDKKQFIDIGCNLPMNNKGRIVHPLSLLTAIGNGNFYTSDKKMLSYVGSWVGDSISAEDSVPNGYEEIKPDFVENWENFNQGGINYD